MEKYEVLKMEPKQPGVPYCQKLTSNTVALAWNKPQFDNSKIQGYELKYKKVGEKQKWVTVETESNMNSFSIEGLKSKTKYVFKVRAVFEDDDDDDDERDCFSNVSQDIETKQSPSAAILNKATKEKNGEIYKLPLTILPDSVNIKAKSRKCVFGNRLPISSDDKTIMMVGETGSGKSTVINGMVNYIMGVDWEDNWRFNIIDLVEEEEKNENDQTKSQTEWITCYTICVQEGSQLDYTLNIIDTPGFGDTRGIERDKAIVNQITELFNTKGEKGIQDLDAVCFVAKAPDVRLTKSQTYIFDQILSIFGKNIESNLFVLTTFTDDAQNPKVIEALRAAKVPFKKYFPFNNVALFSTNKTQLGLQCWNMGKTNYGSFFDHLRQNERCSLQQSAEVLKTRKNLEVKIKAMKEEMEMEMKTIEQIAKIESVIKEREKDINLNKDFIYNGTKLQSIKIDLKPGEHVTNCSNCHMTCHHPCTIKKDSDKYSCAAMKNGKCTICEKRCSWDQHFNYTYYVKVEEVVVKMESKELKDQFYKAKEGKQVQTAMLEEVQKKQGEHKQKLYSMTQDAHTYINELNKIALKHNALSEIEYLEILIHNETAQADPGYMKRIELYEDMKKQAMIIRQIESKKKDEDAENVVAKLLVKF